MSGAYYNEHDPFAAAWLRGLIAEGLIAPGHVDERSIELVQPADLAGFTQCHFFAGIGGWSLALRLAGWPDSRPVWTGSCPCQPFSSAGKGGGFQDSRHLWPTWFRLIRECRPAVVFGEQSASKAGLAWLDHVSTDLEAIDYAFGAADLCAAGVGAPHIRQRLFFVAHGAVERRGAQPQRAAGAHGRPSAELGRLRDAGGLADTGSQRGGDAARSLEAHQGRCADTQSGEPREYPEATLGRGRADGSTVGDTSSTGLEVIGLEPARCERATAERAGEAIGLAHDDGERCALRTEQDRGAIEPGQRAPRRLDAGGCGGPGRMADTDGGQPSDGDLQRRGEQRLVAQDGRPGPWDDLVWLPCRDGKLRPTKPGLFPLASGVPGRVGLLRGAGNSIVPQVAAEFIQAWLEVTSPTPQTPTQEDPA